MIIQKIKFLQKIRIFIVLSSVLFFLFFPLASLASNEDAEQSVETLENLEKVESVEEKNSININVMQAYRNGNLEEVLNNHEQEIVADIDQVEFFSNRTVLMLASIYGDINTVNLLLARGAKVDLKDRDERTALMLVSQEELNNYGRIIPVKKSPKNSFDIAKALLAQNAQVDYQDSNGETALMYASRSDCADIVEMLLRNNAMVDCQNKYGKTAFMYASQLGSIEIINLLLGKGADINLADNSGTTALMLASRSGKVDAVRLLLKKGAEINAMDSDGQTALMHAADWDQLDTVEMLLDNGAIEDLTDNEGKTAFMVAVLSNKPKMTERLVNAININSYGYKHTEPHSIGEVIAWTPLMAAARYGCTKAMEVLLDNGAVVDLTDQDGYTALMISCRWCSSTEVIKILLARGADPYKKNIINNENTGNIGIHDPNHVDGGSVFKSRNKDFFEGLK